VHVRVFSFLEFVVVIASTPNGVGVVIAPLDIFAVEKNGAGIGIWLSSAETLNHALDLMRKRGAGQYLVYSQETGHKNFYAVDAEGAVSQTNLQS
jgi:hypothetical protein